MTKLLALAAACLIAAGCASEPQDQSGLARAMAQVFVKQELRSPAGAKFSPGSETTVTQLQTGVWQVRGWVDAPNAFGTPVRSDFYVELYPEPSGETWKRQAILITPR